MSSLTKGVAEDDQRRSSKPHRCAPQAVRRARTTYLPICGSTDMRVGFVGEGRVEWYCEDGVYTHYMQSRRVLVTLDDEDVLLLLVEVERLLGD